MSEEQPADMLARLGSDGFLWAQEFNKTAVRLGYSEMDEGWLIGWFANAIENSCNPLRNECDRLREENARLRQLNCNLIRQDECDELREENARLREALKTFALKAPVQLTYEGKAFIKAIPVSESELEAARDALKEPGDEKAGI